MISSCVDEYSLIVGSSGQDGFFLNKHLHAMGRKTLCIDQKGLINREKKLLNFDITNPNDVSELFQTYSIDQVYYLAAYHHSADDPTANNLETLKKSMDIHVYALKNFLDAIQKHSPITKIFYAASSHLFSGLSGTTDKEKIVIDENTPISPLGWYAHTKAIGVELMRTSRNNGLYAVSGFLFNHESEKRPISFLSSKLTHGAISALLGHNEKISLLNIDARVDWGYAPDFVRAMQLCLDEENPQDYVISTGKLHTIENYAHLVYGLVGLKWQDHIIVNDNIRKKHNNASALVGNSSRLNGATGWLPSVNFDEMVTRILLDTAKAKNVKLRIN